VGNIRKELEETSKKCEEDIATLEKRGQHLAGETESVEKSLAELAKKFKDK